MSTTVVNRQKRTGSRALLSRRRSTVKNKAAKKTELGATGESVAGKLRHRLGLTQPEFAGLLPVSVRTLATLESGTAPTGPIVRRLIELERLTKALGEVLRTTAIGEWLKTPNRAFGGLKPLEKIDRGESDQLWEMIYFLRSGAAF